MREKETESKQASKQASKQERKKERKKEKRKEGKKERKKKRAGTVCCRNLKIRVVKKNDLSLFHCVMNKIWDLILSYNTWVYNKWAFYKLFLYKNDFSRALVVHVCNPRYLGGRDQEDHGSKPAQANSLQDPISKTQKPFTKK
jgi:hypothetical protein